MVSDQKPVFTAETQRTQRVIFLLFSVEKDGKQQTQALRGTNERQRICVLRVFSSIPVKSERKLFLFCPLSRKETILFLCELCASAVKRYETLGKR